MSMKTPTPRWRVVVSLLALAFVLGAHSAAGTGPVPEALGLAAGVILLLLLARAAVAGNIGWPIGHR